MRWLLACGAGWTLALGAGQVAAQDLRKPLVTLGRPQPMLSAPEVAPATPTAAVATISAPRPKIRAQAPDFPPMNVPPPPPPPPGGLGGPAVFPGGPAAGPGPTEEAYNCGVVTNDSDLGGFWTRAGDHFRRGWSDLTGSVTGAATSRNLFQSDHEFDEFISPVSNPVFFEDPRALTELRPGFIWQRTRSDNLGFAGGNNFFALLQGRLAITPWFSLVVNKLGYNWVDGDGVILQDGDGFSELHVGPKVTFYRDETSCTVMALGLNVELAIGSKDALQDTGSYSLSPYFSWSQRVYRTPWGTINFGNTTGYSLALDSERTDFLYVSGHLDFDVADQHKFYPLIEVNWTYYTQDGGVYPIKMEGNNLFNLGAKQAAGQNDLTLATGFRYKFNENVQFGIVGEMSLIGGGNHMDQFRLTADMIFRY